MKAKKKCRSMQKKLPQPIAEKRLQKRQVAISGEDIAKDRPKDHINKAMLRAKKILFTAFCLFKYNMYIPRNKASEQAAQNITERRIAVIINILPCLCFSFLLPVIASYISVLL